MVCEDDPQRTWVVERALSAQSDTDDGKIVAQTDPPTIGCASNDNSPAPSLAKNDVATSICANFEKRWRSRQRGVPDRVRVSRIERGVDRETSTPSAARRAGRKQECRSLFGGRESVRRQTSHIHGDSVDRGVAIPTSAIDDRDHANSHSRSQGGEVNSVFASFASCQFDSTASAHARKEYIP